MSIVELKEKLHQYIENAAESELRAIIEMLENEVTDHSHIPEWYYSELDKRRNRYLSAESKSFTLEEVKESILNRAAKK